MWLRTCACCCSREPLFWLLVAENERPEPKIDLLFTPSVNMSRMLPGEPTQKDWWAERSPGLISSFGRQQWEHGHLWSNKAYNNTTDLCCCVVVIHASPRGDTTTYFFFVCFFSTFLAMLRVWTWSGTTFGDVGYDGTDFFNFHFLLSRLEDKLESTSVKRNYVYRTCTRSYQSLVWTTLTLFTA